MRCPRCETDKINDAEFCHKCGFGFRQQMNQAGAATPPFRAGATQAPYLGNGQLQPRAGERPAAAYPPSQHMGRGSYPPQHMGQGSYPPQGMGRGSYPPQHMGQGSYPPQGMGQGSYPPQGYPHTGQAVQPPFPSYPGTQVPMNSTSYPRSRYGGQGLLPEERLKIMKRQAKIRDRYKNPGIAIGSLTIAFVAIVLVLISLSVEFAHYVGIGIGVIACACAIFARRRNARLALFAFMLGLFATLGGAALAVLDFMEIFTIPI